MYYAVPYSNYIVCLSQTVAVPVFVAPQLPVHARNAMMAFPVFNSAYPDFWKKKIYSNTILTCMYVFVDGLVMVEYANACAEYILDHIVYGALASI